MDTIRQTFRGKCLISGGAVQAKFYEKLSKDELITELNERCKREFNVDSTKAKLQALLNKYLHGENKDVF